MQSVVCQKFSFGGYSAEGPGTKVVRKLKQFANRFRLQKRSKFENIAQFTQILRLGLWCFEGLNPTTHALRRHWRQCLLPCILVILLLVCEHAVWTAKPEYNHFIKSCWIFFVSCTPIWCDSSLPWFLCFWVICFQICVRHVVLIMVIKVTVV